MAFANSSWSDVIASTIEHRSGKISDQVSLSNALLAQLKRKGRIRTFSGGRSIVEELAFAENPNFGWYSGYDRLPVGPADVLSAAEFAIKQCAVPVTVSGLELLQNRGKEQVFDLVEARLNVAESTMMNKITEGIYSDGTGSSGKQITGLDAAVPQDPTTGTYGGINRATYTFWRPQIYDPAATPTTATIQTHMNTLWALCVRGADRPDLIVAGATIWGTFMGSMQPLQRFTDSGTANLGFSSIKFMDADVVLDGSNAVATDMYFLNTKYIHYRPHSARDMVPLTPTRRVSVNQDAEVQILAWAGNLTMSGSKMQGRLKGD